MTAANPASAAPPAPPGMNEVEELRELVVELQEALQGARARVDALEGTVTLSQSRRRWLEAELASANARAARLVLQRAEAYQAGWQARAASMTGVTPSTLARLAPHT